MENPFPTVHIQSSLWLPCLAVTFCSFYPFYIGGNSGCNLYDFDFGKSLAADKRKDEHKYMERIKEVFSVLL